jgi:hypothetical protein
MYMFRYTLRHVQVTTILVNFRSLNMPVYVSYIYHIYVLNILPFHL